MLRRALNVVIALGALLAMSAALHGLLPPPYVETVTPKLRYFAAHQDEFDTLFIGTSRIAHHIDPQIFDRVTAEHGRPTRSFNFGIDGMHPAENFFVIEQLLKARPRKLRHVFFELEDVLTDWSAEARGTQRLAYWHDWKRTEQTLRKIVDPYGNGRWYAKVIRLVIGRRAFVSHLSLFGKQFLNLGRAADLISPPSATTADAQIGPHHDGYRPPREAMRGDRVRAYEQKLERESSRARSRPIDPYADQSYRAFAEEFRQLGAESLFVVTPIVTQSPLHFPLTPPPPGPVLSFNDRRAFPQLYRAEVRVDESHLSREGAEEFTRLLADRFAQSTR